MKNLKRLLLVTMSVFCLLGNTLAMDSSDANTEITTQVAIETRKEQVEWFFREHNGVPQMRLWSYTYAKWLTDWIDLV